MSGMLAFWALWAGVNLAAAIVYPEYVHAPVHFGIVGWSLCMIFNAVMKEAPSE